MAFNVSNFTRFCRKIVGITMNYKKLIAAKGLKEPIDPIIFLKPSSSIIVEKDVIKIPKGFKVNYEIELGVIISERCKNVVAGRIDEYIGGYCLALDLTASNILEKARKEGNPWAIGKGFDTACPVSQPITSCQLEDHNNAHIWLSIDGCMKVSDTTADMFFPVENIISYISKYMTLEPYDLVITGTPGIGEIKPGQKLTAGLGKDLIMTFDVCEEDEKK